MKKKLLLIPLFATLLCGCTLEDLMFWKTKDNEQGQKDEQKDDKPGDDDTTPPSDTTVHVTGVNIVKASTTIEERQSETLEYTVSPTTATNKEVEWHSSDPTVVSVNEGVIYGVYPGTATITLTSLDDRNKQDTCTVTVTEKTPEFSTISADLNFSELYEHRSGTEIKPYTDPVAIDEAETIHATFTKDDGSTDPACYLYKGVWAARMYPKNKLTIASSDATIRRIEFTFDSNKDSPSNEITSDPEGFETNVWIGSAKTVVFTAGGSDGCRAISNIKVTYDGEEVIEEDINLHVKSIAEVKEYIAEHPVTKNAFGNGVNEHVMVTIKAFALAKIDLVKTASAFGLDVSYPAKVIMADSTGSIGVATKNTGDGTSLWGKIDDHVCESTSSYIVTGYISEYLGHPELMVTSFTWDKDLDISWNAEILSEATSTIENFYTLAKDIDYNCAGHGYGKVLTLNKLKCFYLESDGSGVRYYNFTDGTSNIRVNAFNLSSVSVGSNYDIIGITSIKSLSPIIVAFKITKSSDQSEIEFDYETTAGDSISIASLKAIHGSKDDTSTKYPEVIEAYGNVYKTTGYLTCVYESGNCYYGLSDTFIPKSQAIDNKLDAVTENNVTLFKNNWFWNSTDSKLLGNYPGLADYLFKETQITMYYVLRQAQDQKKSGQVAKFGWETLLIPESLEVYKA